MDKNETIERFGLKDGYDEQRYRVACDMASNVDKAVFLCFEGLINLEKAKMIKIVVEHKGKITETRPQTEFNIFLNRKLQEMYDDNKISESDKSDIKSYTGMFKKAFHFDSSLHTFDSFELYHIERAGEFLEIDKDEYSMNQFAVEVCEYFFNLKPDLTM